MLDKSDVITDPCEAELIADPLKYQMWHHTFDPHTEVPRVKPAQLTSPPQISKSVNMNEFINKAGGSTTSIVKGALEETKNQAKQDSNQEESAEDKETRLKLEAMSKETGISIETLKVIKQVENKVSQTR